MTIVEKSIPLHLLGMKEGDAIVGYRMEQGHIILQIARGLLNQPRQPGESQEPPRAEQE